jgi:hypothetical protein
MNCIGSLNPLPPDGNFPMGKKQNSSDMKESGEMPQPACRR